MSTLPENLKYTDTHEWILVEGDIATVGITDHAQSELSDVVYVELPAVGKAVKARESTAVVESVKAASDIYAPVTGEIIAVNNNLTADPGLINRSPYDDAWIFKLKMTGPSELELLKDAAAYQAKIG